MLNAFFTISPSSGDVLATDFTVTNLTSGASVARYAWSFGTGEIIYNVLNPTYTYDYPGVYTVSLSATDYDNNQSTYSQTVTAQIAYRDYIKFIQIPELYPDPGKFTDIPFKIEVLTTAIDKPIIVDLFADNSKSTPEEFIPSKWKFISPTWSFFDTNNTRIKSLSVVPTPVYKNNKIVAVSGTAEFYYVDSMSSGDPTKNCPLLITATVQTSGFVNPLDSRIYNYESHANNETLRTAVIWLVNDLFPNTLRVTGNYIDNINPYQWKDIKVPVLITCHSNRSLLLSGSPDSLSEPIFSYPESNQIGQISPLQLTLSGLPSTDYIIDEAPLYFQTTDSNGFRSGGYVFTTVTPTNTGENISIFAQTNTNTNIVSAANQFIYPGPFAPNPAVWVSNPQKNTLNKITLIPDPGNCNTIQYFRERGILADGTVKEIEVPFSQSTATINYEMSGFSGIYGVAVDPRNYDLIAADTELDRLYKFSNSGKLLKTFELSSIQDYDPRKKIFSSWTWTTPSPLASATRFTLYSPTLISPNPANYITSIGGVIQPADYTEIDTFASTIRLLVSPNYPPQGVTFDAFQIYNPALPQEYISSLKYWTLSSSSPTTAFALTTGTPLSANSGHYVVSVGGVLQRPSSYTVDDITKTIVFGSPVPSNNLVHILYIPKINSPAVWSTTLSAPTTSFSLTGSPLYQLDDQSGFLVNIGGVLQSQTNFRHDITNQQLVFTSQLPINTPIDIVQFSIPDTINVPAAYTPAYVSLDKNYNIWVSLFNSVSVLKFDSDLNLLLSVAPSSINWNTRAWVNPPDGLGWQSSFFGDQTRYVNPTGEDLDLYYNEFFAKPPVVETDKDSNCWVTYAHPLCSLIVKYSSTGQSLLEIPTGQYSSPINITVNSQNNIWVSNFHGSVYTYTPLSGSIQLYNGTTGSLLSTVTGISRPGHIALDRNNNIWFTHSTKRIGYFNTGTSTLSMWTMDLSGGLKGSDLVGAFTVYTIPSSYQVTNYELFDEAENEENEEIGGLAVDVYDRVWILDNLRNFAWVISASPNFLEAPIRYFKIKPDATIGYYLDLDTGSTYTETGDYYYRSAQATGDWTGNRWYQKYATPELLTQASISGISEPFNVTEFVNKHQINRINESFNNAEYYKSLALPENLQSNPALWDQFFAAAVGTAGSSSYEDLGQTIYEKIANFVINHADVDTCNIDQLLSLAEQVAVPASDYSAIYPTDIRKMLDIASVSRARLWGIKDEVPLIPQSIGEEYNTLTDYVTAGTKLFLRSRFSSDLSLIPVPQLSTTSNTSLSVYPVSAFEGYGFVQPIPVNYLIYRYEPVFSNKFVENIIDWESSYTTQSVNLSTINEWYGPNGGIEKAFRYLLTKNLFLK